MQMGFRGESSCIDERQEKLSPGGHSSSKRAQHPGLGALSYAAPFEPPLPCLCQPVNQHI